MHRKRYYLLFVLFFLFIFVSKYDVGKEIETVASLDAAAITDISGEEGIIPSGNDESTPSQITYIAYELPNVNTSFKAYMDYTLITDRQSAQYQLQADCWTDKDGLRRHGDDYCVALGSYYSTQIGQRFRITLEQGQTFTAVLADAKSDQHTDELHMYTPRSGVEQNLLEFVVDQRALDERVRKAGTVCGLGFQGNIIKIEKITERKFT